MENKIQFYRIDNDTNGNPRYVCHFYNLITEKDKEEIKENFGASLSVNPFRLTEFLYDEAILKAKKLGGKKYHTKKFGGGIVFQSYNIQETERRILELVQTGE
jgi:hypothetical protein